MNDARGRRPRPALSRLCACAALALWIAGCSGAPPPPVPATKEKAAASNRRGIAAEARGDREAAVAAFTDALRHNRSIEDTEGAAVALVNLARVHRLQGDVSRAKQEIDEAAPFIPRNHPLYPELAFEEARIALASGDLPNAKAWAGKAVDADQGEQAGRRMNLLARVLFLDGNVDEAFARAETALSLNRKAGLREEEANSRRLLGDVAAARKDARKAAENYAAALAVDKDIAKSRKIAADLRALGALAAGSGDAEKALAFYRRAYVVSVNGDDVKEAAAALEEMAKLHETSGAPDKATAARSEREKLLKSLETR